jgi:hypothetical protein
MATLLVIWSNALTLAFDISEIILLQTKKTSRETLILSNAYRVTVNIRKRNWPI